MRSSVEKYGTSVIPSFEEIINGLQLSEKKDELPPDKDGILADNIIIINTQVRSEERKQFTRFHEVTHYLIKQDGELISDLHDTFWHDKKGYERILERLCNIGAAEFLMPREEFRRLCEETGFRVGLITEASQHFGSSKIATTIQLAQVAPYPCITAICEYGVMPNRTEHQRSLFPTKGLPSSQLYILYSAASPSVRYLLARYSVIPDEHTICDAFHQGEAMDQESYVPFPSGKKMPCRCEALRHFDRVYVIFHLGSEPDSRQLKFGFVIRDA